MGIRRHVGTGAHWDFRLVGVGLIGALILATHLGCGKAQQAAQNLSEDFTEGASKLSDQIGEKFDEHKGTLSDKVGELGADAQKLVKGGVGSAGAQLGLAGKVELQTPQVTTSALHAQLLTSTAGRPNVLSLQSYPVGQDPPAGAVYARAMVQASTLAELKESDLDAQLFAEAADGSVWYSKPGEPVKLKVTVVEDNRIEATVSSGKLYNTDRADVVDAQGSLVGVLAP